MIEARNLSENTRVEQVHDGSGQLDECDSSSAHTVKEQHVPPRTTEFNRAINEEDIDFNVPCVPHSTVKQLDGASVRELIQKIENHPNRTLFNETYNKVTVGSVTMPVRDRLGFKQSSTLRQLKTNMMQFISKDGRKALLRLGGIGKNLGGILLMSITTKTYPAPIDQGKLDRKLIGPLFEV